MSPFDPTTVASELRDAELRGAGVQLLTDRFTDLSPADARAVALARDDLRRDAGDHQIGYKLGWTSAAMREALGIDRSNWGTLWASQRLGATLDLADLIHPRIEPEFVYVAGRALRGDVSTDEVADSCAGWAVGLEVVDPRFESWSFGWLDNTADNSSAARVRTSQVATAPGLDAFDPENFELVFTDGDETREGIGAGAMGSPLEAVAWLVRQLAAEGQTLSRGDLVYTGGITAPFALLPDRTYTVTSASLAATVSLLIAGPGASPAPG